MNAPTAVIDAPWLTGGAVAQLLAILNGGGEEARVVGGAVRNALLGEPPGDIDVATTALPATVTERAGAAGLRTVPTGIEHGTVTVIVDGRPIEVTTLRQDVETFGRRAVVHFGRDWSADAHRRDFTMNGLSVLADGTVIDHVGGIADLAARRVRFIGDPGERIREDYLRILRFFRFHAAYGHGAPDPEGLHAAVTLRAGLARLSRERIRMELMKLLVAPGAAATLSVMADCGLLAPILGVVMVPSLARLAAIDEHQGQAADPVRRLGTLALHATDDAERLCTRLRLSKTETGRLAAMVAGWRDLAADPGEKAGRALLYRLGAGHFRDRVLLAWSRSGAPANDAAWRNLATLPQRWQPPTFPLKAADLIARGVAKGPRLGAALQGAEAAWIAAGFPHDAAALARLADEWASRTIGEDAPAAAGHG